MGTDERRRVAVLGGGVGSLVTAFELTATPELRERYEVTVHQLGWRLGGKGASGRRPVGAGHPAQRIEEHGLHVWFGFYENAFDVIRRVFGELDRKPGAPLATWEEAFHPTDEVVLLDDTTGAWQPMRFSFPGNDAEPGLPGPSPTLRRLLRDALEMLKEVEPPAGAHPALRLLDAAVDRLLEVLETLLAGGDDDRVDLGDVFSAIVKVTDGVVHMGGIEDRDLDGELDRDPLVCRLLLRLRDFVWWATDGDRYAMTFDLVATVFRGIIRDDLEDEGFGTINDQELLAWLARHGARTETLRQSPILRAFYQLCFAYADGHRDRPSLAAGKALQAMLRMCLGYRGALMWKMQAGMGDAVFAPLYEVLRARGVRFSFFHDVQALRLSPDGRHVDRLEIRRQAEVVHDNGEYRPLVADAGGLASWPASPLAEQLRGVADLRGGALPNFEAGGAMPGAATLTLRRGEDFDDVVLGLSVASLPPVCHELAAGHEPFARMLEHARTVATQALQVWMTVGAEELGVAAPGMISGAYVEPLDTMCDMSHLLGREGWPAADGVRSIAYFCGTMTEIEGETQQEADDRARADGLAHLRARCAPLWPGSQRPGRGFDWAMLADPEDRDGPERLEAQYWRANVFGSERYVLTPPGSIEHRLRPGESGCENLALAGDWTRNGICGGSVEAAATSGKLAAQFLTGSQDVVPGTDGWLELD